MNRSQKRSPPRQRGSSSSKGTRSSSPSYSQSSVSSERLYKSTMCNLIMPVPRVKAMLKVNNYAGRVSETGAIFLTAVLEYIATEIIELSLNASKSDGVRRIQAKHVNKAIKTDPEFAKNFRNASVIDGGIVPYRHDTFLAVTNNVPLNVILDNTVQRPSKKRSRSSKYKVSRRKTRKRKTSI